MKRVVIAAAATFLLALSAGSALADRTDTVWLDNDILVAPGKPVIVRLGTNAAANRPIHLMVYRLSLRDAIAFARGGYNSAAGTFAKHALVREGNVLGSATSYWAQREVSAGVLPIGLYAIVASIGSAHAAVLADVTTLGVMSVSGSRPSAFWAIDLRTFRRHAGPTMLSFVESPNDDSVLRYRCDVSGLVLASIPPETSFLVAQTQDGSADIEPVSRSESDDERHNVVYVQTDRPIYRLGQDVHLRGIVRSGYLDRYAIPRGTHEVHVIDPAGNQIAKRTISLSRFGTFNDDLSLPENGQLGSYQIQLDGAAISSFSVQAYKKPEYLITAQAARPVVVGGDDARITVSAKYFFGRPAAGMHVHYTYGPQDWWNIDSNPFRRFRPYHYEWPQWSDGNATVGSDGNAVLTIATKPTKFAYTLSVRVEARDDSGRTVETSRTVGVWPAGVNVELTPRQWFARPGDDVAIDLSARTQQLGPSAHKTLRIAFSRSEWDRTRSAYIDEKPETQAVMTDAEGAATVHWRPMRSGSYTITASAVDERGRKAESPTSLWVIGEDDAQWMPPSQEPLVVAQHAKLETNERPRVLIRMPSPGSDVLVAVESDRLISARVVHVTGYAISLGFDAPSQASQFSVHVEMPAEFGVSDASADFERMTPSSALRIALHADRKTYQPGDRATFDIAVSDINGKPVTTELSLGVVDDAIYAVQEENRQSALATFYGDVAIPNVLSGWRNPNYTPPQNLPELPPPPPERRVLKTIAAVRARGALLPVPSGTSADTYSVLQRVPVREKFAETAYWTPAVVTDEDGRARVRFTWPDNLTTWRTTALGVTVRTQIGLASAQSLVSKPFLVRLETPRFARKGDRAQITAIFHGESKTRRVNYEFSVSDASPLDGPLQLDGNLTASTSWMLPFDSLGPQTLTLAGTDGVRSDAMRLTLPVEAAGAAEHVRDAGLLPRDAQLNVRVPAGYDAGTLDITLTPSVAAQLVQNLRLLDVYPYYCTEQTMSAALPAIFVDRLIKRMGLALPQDLTPKQVIRHAIAHLQELQHDDGSWGWWSNDPAHPFMTAYAMYGLTEFKKAGYAVPDAMYDRGLESLHNQLRSANRDTLRLWGGAQAGSEWNTRAYMLFVLADVDPNQADSDILAQTLRRADSLNSYALSVLGLAYHAYGDDRTARSLLAKLNMRAAHNGPYTYWSGATWHYAWEDDPIETTAYALRLNAALAPDSPIVQSTIAFLRSEQNGSWWYTTKDSAAAIYAIAEAEEAGPEEFHPDQTIAIYADGRPVRSVHVTAAVLDAATALVRVPAGMLRDGSVVRFERTGRGKLFWQSDFTRYAPAGTHAVRDSNRSIFARLFPAQPPIRIERRYYATHPGRWSVGDEINVQTSVTANEDVQYVAIEDPFPAGVEYQPPQGEGGREDWSGMQYFDDRAVFFATKLYDRQTLQLSYTLRVTTPGTYTAAAPTAYGMYGPPVSAVGDSERIIVQR